MTDRFILSRLLTLSLLAFAWTNSYANDYTPAVCPTPERIEVSATDYSPLRQVFIECKTSESAKIWAEKHLKQWYGDFAPETKTKTLHGESPIPGGYTLDIKEGEVRIRACDLDGVRHALFSLRQLVIPARGTKTVQGYIAPETTIEDRPAMGFRGVHLCWFPETDAADIERKIRMAAYYKFNYVVIESWGTFRSEKNPWLGWPDGKMTKEEIIRLRTIAEDLGVTLIPQFNVFGHASGSRIRSGKHASLDFSPEYQPLFEPEGGWNWCLSNPETFKVQSEMICEMLEAFGNPPFFHIGCDEAEAPSCPDCIRQPYSELFVRHLTAICELLARNGARAMMWHDMLLEKGDPRWKGFYANGTKQTSDVSRLPKSIVVCDWFYGGPCGSYPTLDYFKEEGFDVLSCPKANLEGIVSQGQYVRKSGLFGVLGTTWAEYYGKSYVSNLSQLADAVWSMDLRPAIPWNKIRLRFATHLRHIGWDMGISDYRDTGFYEVQVDDDVNRL